MALNLSKEEIEALKEIDSTDGIEWPWQNDILDALRAKRLVSFSGRRGPGKVWFRVTLTEDGLLYLKSLSSKKGAC